MKDFICRHRRLLQVLLSLLLLLPQLRLLYLTRVQPTGDALYDRYQSAVLGRMRWQLDLPVLGDWIPWRLYKPRQPLPYVLDDGLLASWEADFGSDPRYWELRYCNDMMAGRTPESGTYGTDNAADAWQRRDAVRHLARAEELGVDDGHLQALLLPYKFSSLNRHYAELWSQPLSHGESLDLTVQQEDEQRRLIEEAVRVSLDNAWPAYDRWEYEAGFGVSDELYERLDAANQLPCPPRVPFPLSFVHENLTGKCGNPLVAGCVLEAGIELDFGSVNLIRVKDRCKELQIASPLRGYEPCMDSIWQMMLREGYLQNPGYPLLGLAICNMQAGMLLDEVPTQLEPHEAAMLEDQREKIHSIYKLYLQWRDEALANHTLAFSELQHRQHDEQGVFADAQRSGPPSLMEQAFGRHPSVEEEHPQSERLRWRIPAVRYRELFDLQRSQAEFLDSQVMPLIEELRAFHIGQYGADARDEVRSDQLE
ncbi:hypothetical protein KDL44_06825 [bacterium]|nr:hypothetical protein [bacterium]